MASTLKYRYPNSEIVEKSGQFVSYDGQVGFLISDFSGKNTFVFEEKEEISQLHFRDVAPIVILQHDYLSSAESFLNEIKSLNLGKAVLSRVKSIPFNHHKANDLFVALCEKYPSAFVYFLSDEALGTWIGASPEVLLQANEDRIQTMALAGTLPSNSSASWTTKEELEQALVTDYIKDILTKNKVKDLKISERFEKSAGPVKHLCNEISFSKVGIDLQKIAFLLHPTPAVSGLPKSEAMELIARHETHDRSLYAGIIGIQDNLYVNLRCCEIQENTAYLYLGGGFTAQSDVQKEWEETENKSKTLISVINTIH
ncbi:MAG: chorismate-binding protein [Bacteroidota bacterium]